MLQVVVEPRYCPVLEAFWYDHFAFVTEYFDVFDQLYGLTLLVSLCFKVVVLVLCLCYLSCSEWIDGILFVSISKHKVHGFLGVGWGRFMLLCGVVITPALSKSHPV